MNTNIFIPTMGYINMLTDTKIKRLKPTADKKPQINTVTVMDYNFYVFPTGRMTWIYAYRFNGKQKI